MGYCLDFCIFGHYKATFSKGFYFTENPLSGIEVDFQVVFLVLWVSQERLVPPYRRGQGGRRNSKKI